MSDHDFSGAMSCNPDVFKQLRSEPTADESKAIDIAQRFGLGITTLQDGTLFLFYVTYDAGPFYFLLSDLETHGGELFYKSKLLATVES